MYTGVHLYGCIKQQELAFAGIATGSLYQNTTCMAMMRRRGRRCRSACAAWRATGLPPCSLRAPALRPCKPHQSISLSGPNCN